MDQADRCGYKVWHIEEMEGLKSPMDVDQQIAATLGFPKSEYTVIERERRWLCREVPPNFPMQTEKIIDLYITGTRLRLREARPIDGGEARLRFTRKADINSRTRLITSIYLPEEEFSALKAVLPGSKIMKLRHKFCLPSLETVVAIDEFQEDLQGLILAEVEFTTAESMNIFPAPDFVDREVTDDARFTGAYLAKYGCPNAADF